MREMMRGEVLKKFTLMPVRTDAQVAFARVITSALGMPAATTLSGKPSAQMSAECCIRIDFFDFSDGTLLRKLTGPDIDVKLLLEVYLCIASPPAAWLLDSVTWEQRIAARIMDMQQMTQHPCHVKLDVLDDLLGDDSVKSILVGDGVLFSLMSAHRVTLVRPLNVEIPEGSHPHGFILTPLGEHKPFFVSGIAELKEIAQLRLGTDADNLPVMVGQQVFHALPDVKPSDWGVVIGFDDGHLQTLELTSANGYPEEFFEIYSAFRSDGQGMRTAERVSLAIIDGR